MNANEGADFPATADVGAQRVAEVYAEALLNAAANQGQADSILGDLQSLLADVFQAAPEFEAFLKSGAIGRDRKAEVIRSAFENRASPLITNFLLVLNDHERLDLLRPILVAARELADQRAKRVRVRVRSAVPLPNDQRDRLSQQIRDTLRLEPIVEAHVDTDILGGLVVQVGDWQYDASVRTQLDILRSQLIERSSHEIQSRRDRFCSTDGN
jgi:F-type H+-transporting ATPase subunit delta